MRLPLLIHASALMTFLVVVAACDESGAPERKAKDGSSKDGGDSDDDDDDANRDGNGNANGLPGGNGVMGGTGASTGTVTGTGMGTGNGATGGSIPAEKRSISFPGSRGDTVPGYLWLPARNAGQRFPAVLVMYGINGSKDDGSIGAAAVALSNAGFAAFTIDWPGTGERGTISNQDRITKSDVLQWTVGDYGAAVQYVGGLPEVDVSRLGYVGASMGAMTGAAFAARDPRVKAMVAIVPIPDPLWGADDPSSRIGQISPRPVLCISTDDNSDFSATVCARVGSGGEQRALPGGHELEGFREQVVTATTAFLTTNLRP